MVLNDKDTRLLALAYFAIDGTPKVNYDVLSTLTGMTKGSASVRFMEVKRKAKELQDKGEAVIDYGLGGGRTPKKEAVKKSAPKSKTENVPRASKATGEVGENPKRRATALKAASTIRAEQPSSETEPGTQADEEDNTGSGAVTDASPAAPELTALTVEIPSPDSNAGVNSSGDESEDSTIQVKGNKGKSAMSAQAITPTGKKRTRANSQKKTASSSPSAQVSASDDETVNTPSKKFKETPDTQTPATPSARAFKRGSVNNPTGSAPKTAPNVELGSHKVNSPAQTTDGANDIVDNTYHTTRWSRRNTNTSVAQASIKGVTDNNKKPEDEVVALRAESLAQERLIDMLKARRLNSSGPSSSSSSPTPSIAKARLQLPSHSLDTDGATDTSTHAYNPNETNDFLVGTGELPAPPHASEVPETPRAKSTTVNDKTLSPTHSPGAYKRKPFKLTPGRPIGQSTPTAITVAACEIPRPRTPTPASASKVGGNIKGKVMDVGSAWRKGRAVAAAAAKGKGMLGAGKDGNRSDGEGEEEGEDEGDTITVAKRV